MTQFQRVLAPTGQLDWAAVNRLVVAQSAPPGTK